jgi:hypothetical protein
MILKEDMDLSSLTGVVLYPLLTPLLAHCPHYDRRSAWKHCPRLCMRHYGGKWFVLSGRGKWAILFSTSRLYPFAPPIGRLAMKRDELRHGLSDRYPRSIPSSRTTIGSATSLLIAKTTLKSSFPLLRMPTRHQHGLRYDRRWIFG